MMAEWEGGELNGEWHIMTGWALSDGHDHGRTPGQVNVLCRKKKRRLMIGCRHVCWRTHGSQCPSMSKFAHGRGCDSIAEEFIT